jgi:hypothetical protein
MSNLIKQEQNLAKWQIEKLNYLEAYMAVNSGLLKIENKAITGVTSHERCIVEDSCQLSEMIEKNGSNVCKNNIHNFIELFIIEIFEWFGKEIKENLSQNLAKTIYENYYFLKIAEFKLFVEKMKSGHWKQVHNLSPAVIMERLHEFVVESMNIREQIVKNNTGNERSFLAENGELISGKLMPVFLRVNEIKNNTKLAISKIEDKKRSQKDFWKTHDWFSENKLCYEWLEKQKESQFIKLGWYQIFLLRKQI